MAALDDDPTAMLAALNMTVCLQVAEDAAREAGKLIYDAHAARASGSIEVSVKAGVDLVTEVDKASEALIAARLKAAFPKHAFIGEETSADERIGQGPTWIVDPLDGTTNFVHGQPQVAVSIALTAFGQPLVGVIFAPLLGGPEGTMYSAHVGNGAHRNGAKLAVSKAKDLGSALVMNNVGASRSDEFVGTTLRRLEGLLKAGVRGLRNGGGACVNMAMVAEGSLDVCVERALRLLLLCPALLPLLLLPPPPLLRLGPPRRYPCYLARPAPPPPTSSQLTNHLSSRYLEDGYGGPWDVAAGIVIVREAGGVVQQPDGTPFALKMGPGKVSCGGADAVAAVAACLNASDAAAPAAALSYPANAPAEIAVGDAVPAAGPPLTAGANNVEAASLAALLDCGDADGRTVLVGVPGAFTPTCSATHIPGIIEAAPVLATLGVKKVVVLSVNDPWVMAAWGKSLGAASEVMLADGTGALTARLGLLVNKGALGCRGKRFALVVKAGVVEYCGIDSAGLDKSSAASVCKALGGEFAPSPAACSR